MPPRTGGPRPVRPLVNPDLYNTLMQDDVGIECAGLFCMAGKDGCLAHVSCSVKLTYVVFIGFIEMSPVMYSNCLAFSRTACD
jgi:hypothetical protein